MENNNNIHFHNLSVSREQREKLNGHKPAIIWFTGMSGSGKSTIANILDTYLYKNGYHTYILDGDNIRSGLNKNLGFTDEDRKENIRRISEVAKLFADSGTIVSTAFISPFIEDRQIARDILSKDFKFIEIYVEADLATCESRDPKGLYKKARAGQIKNFTGIDSPYEAPVNPELVLKTAQWKPEICAYGVLHYLYETGILPVQGLKIGVAEALEALKDENGNQYFNTDWIKKNFLNAE